MLRLRRLVLELELLSEFLNITILLNNVIRECLIYVYLKFESLNLVHQCRVSQLHKFHLGSGFVDTLGISKLALYMTHL